MNLTGRLVRNCRISLETQEIIKDSFKFLKKSKIKKEEMIKE